jgi:hypothetical protein
LRQFTLERVWLCWQPKALSCVVEAIQIVSQTQQQRSQTLNEQASARSTAGEFTFGGGENGLGQDTAAIEAAGKMVVYFRVYSVGPPAFSAAFGGDDAASSESLTDVGVVEFAIELRVSQHQTDRADGVGGGIHQGTQVWFRHWWGRRGSFAQAPVAGRDRRPPATSASGARAP